MASTAEQLDQQRRRPTGSRVMHQRWSRLLFLHWEMEVGAVQRLLPKGLTVDTYSDRAYVGLVPFFMERVRPVGCPCVPGLSDFLELNIRTYVQDRHGTPGVWFFSLDCSQPIAVMIARTLFHLPYFQARMSAKTDEKGSVHYRSQRHGSNLTCVCDYTFSGPVHQAESGTLDFFLVERYVLFSERNGQLYSGRVHHPPYPLQAIEGGPYSPALFESVGLPVPVAAPANVIGSKGVDVEIFGLMKNRA
jgi:uncharacterized protein YqjF (DUF2071 family)